MSSTVEIEFGVLCIFFTSWGSIMNMGVLDFFPNYSVQSRIFFPSISTVKVVVRGAAVYGFCRGL